MSHLIAVMTTVATREQALALARTLVEQRLAACVQLGAIDSVYRWDGRVQTEPEIRLLCKTRARLWPAIEAAIRASHPYDVPQICAFALDPVHAPYAAWVEAQCLAPASEPPAPPRR